MGKSVGEKEEVATSEGRHRTGPSRQIGSGTQGPRPLDQRGTVPDYDFHQLSPHDLEHLVRDLLQALWSERLESFKTGRDGGIDLRYASGPRNLIVQVKHYVRTGFAGLIRDLKKEGAKIAELTPSRYVVVTSVPLSPANKTKIVGTVSSAPLVAADVFGQGDLNNLLGCYPAIEQRHPKLWLTSRAVLDKVLHNAEVTCSEFEVHKIYQQMRRYVETEVFREAEERLADESVVMVAGPPGIGKTTLANMLLYEHLRQGWQAVVVERDIVEGTKLFQRHVNQIFHFDDFIGATLIDEGVSVNDKALVNFIALVRDDPTSRLILTTREHLYERAVTRSERLCRAGLDTNRVVLRMPRYTPRQRAQILYNHIYFSDLPDAYIMALLEGEFYCEIIHHERLNPRLIQWMTSHRRVRHVPAAKYRAFISQLLDNPLEVWRHAYEEELSHAARSLLLALWSFEGRIGLPLLRRAFSKLHAHRARKYHFVGSPQDFNRALKELNGSFVRSPGHDAVEVVDPSVLDLIGGVLLEAPENAADLLVGAARFSQVERLWMYGWQEGSAIPEEVWHEAAREAAPVVRTLTLEGRRVEHPDGVTTWCAPTYERRLAVVLDIAAEIGTREYRDLIEPLVGCLFEEPLDEGGDIDGLVDLVITLGAKDMTEFSLFVQLLRERAFAAARRGCRVDELRKAARLLGHPQSDNEVAALRAGYAAYIEHYHSDARLDCRSVEDFDELISDLTWCGVALNTESDGFVAELEQDRQELQEEQEQNAGTEAEAYRGRRYDLRREEESIADVFGSLKLDRDG